MGIVFPCGGQQWFQERAAKCRGVGERVTLNNNNYYYAMLSTLDDKYYVVVDRYCANETVNRWIRTLKSGDMGK